MQQLPLGVRLRDRAVFDNFYTGDSHAAVTALKELAAGRGDAALYLHGAAGSGKSHLLQAFCAALPGAAYFPLRELAALGPEVLDGSQALPALAIDEVDSIAGQRHWEQALFTLYNERLGAGLRFVIAARPPAAALQLSLPDLQSRLAGLPQYALRLLDDNQQRDALRLRAAARGLELPDETLNYLQRRFPRGMARLCGLLDQLDAASLAEQRRLTVPFIRGVLDRQG